ncbi:MAG TPA: hypothetical protein VIB82_03715, partial [Caulobacteraceae bacterium]
MTTKILNGTYGSGYTLANTFTGVWVKGTGKVFGASGLSGLLDGADGYTALDLPKTATARNDGVIVGGAGGHGAMNSGNGGYGGAGGVGVSLAAGGSVTNTSALYGGNGGYGGYGGNIGGAGGDGGCGVLLAAKANVTNSGVIQGGAGGDAGLGQNGAGAFGLGGSGVSLRGGGTVINNGRISSGADGAGSGILHNAAVTLVGAGLIVNGSATNASAQIAGYIGVDVSGGTATIKNYGVIDGARDSVFLGYGGRFIAEAGSSTSLSGTNQCEGGGVLEIAGGAGTISDVGYVYVTLGGGITGRFSDFGTYQIDAGANWTLGGAVDVLVGTASLINQGTASVAASTQLLLNDGAQVTDQGALNNNGTLTVQSSAHLTDLRIAGGADVANAGTLEMNGGKARIVGLADTAQFDNFGTTVGSGTIGVIGLTLVNHIGGAIGATGGTLLIDTGAAFLANAGVLAADGGATLTLQKSVVQQSANYGVIEATGGTVNLADAVILGGTLFQTYGGVIQATLSGGRLDGAQKGSGPVVVDAVVNVNNGVTLGLAGTIEVAVALQTLGTTLTSELLVESNGATLAGGGTVELYANLHNRIKGASTGAVLTNFDDLIVGAGQIGGGTMTLVNLHAGTIEGFSTVSLTIDTGAATISNSGTIESGDVGQVIVKSAIANGGNLIAQKGTLTLDG